MQTRWSLPFQILKHIVEIIGPIITPYCYYHLIIVLTTISKRRTVFIVGIQQSKKCSQRSLKIIFYTPTQGIV